METETETETRILTEYTTDKVEQLLFDWILTGKVRAGDKLPSLDDLSSRIGVSYPTISKAVGRLRARRLVRFEPGDGVYVIALEEVAGLELLWPMIEHCNEPWRRWTLLSEFVGFFRPLLADWAERAALVRSKDQLGWLEHFILVLRDRRELKCPRREIAAVEYEIARRIAAAAGNSVFTLVLNSMEGIFLSNALRTESDVWIPLETYQALHDALKDGDGKKAAALVEAALWTHEARCVEELKKLGWITDENPAAA